MYNTPEQVARESAFEARPDAVYTSIGDYMKCRMEKRPTKGEVTISEVVSLGNSSPLMNDIELFIRNSSFPMYPNPLRGVNVWWLDVTRVIRSVGVRRMYTDPTFTER
jgi:hypothetical protein